MRDRIHAIHAAESRRVLARLVGLLGDLSRAEDALQEAFAAALVAWPRDGIPANPAAWLIATGRNKGVDAIRRQARGAALVAALPPPSPTPWAPALIRDDALRLLFVCCHPSLPMHARVALALRVVAGLELAEIARAFGVGDGAMKRRITRAKAHIRDARLPFALPARSALPERLDAVLQVVYLIYTEGHSATAGAEHVRRDLTRRAIELARHVVELLPEPEAVVLLALLLLNEARMPARCTADGELIPLEAQDRTLWDPTSIAEGLELLARVMATGRLGPFGVQAAIASVHVAAPDVEATRWDLIVGYYDVLQRLSGGPFVALNRAIALGMRDGPAAGRAALAALDPTHYTGPELSAALGEFAQRAGAIDDARRAFRAAISRSRQTPRRRYLQRRLAALG